MRLATDFFSLKPIRKISSNISAGLRSRGRNSGSHGARSSVSANRFSAQSRAVSQQENTSENVDVDGSNERKTELSRGVSSRFVSPSFLGGLLSSKMVDNKQTLVNTSIQNVSTKSVKIITSVTALDQENTAEKLKQESTLEAGEEITTEAQAESVDA